MRLGNRLWNVLVTIERTRDTAYRRIMRDDQQTRIDELSAEISLCRELIKKARQSARKRKGADLGDLPERIAAAEAERKPLIAERKATKESRHEAKRQQLDANTERAYRRTIKARQAAAGLGLYWGSYNDIIQRAETARQLARKGKGDSELRYHGFRGEGTVTAQVQGGACVSDCVGGTNTLFQVDPPTPGRKWRYARVRIGSNADRSPVWVEIPIVYHRDLPPEARIKSVSASRRILAGKTHWQLNVSISLPRPSEKTGSRVLALDLGWRLKPEGAVRVGYWADSLGGHGELRIEGSDIAQFQKVADLRSICDKSREQFHPELVEWLGQRELAEEWRTRSAYLYQWRSGERVAALIRWWADNRLPGDEGMFAEAVRWRKQFLHLTDWWRNLQHQMTGRRLARYRDFAAGLARDYDVVVVEEFDLRSVVEHPQPESAAVVTGSGTYRFMASTGTLRLAIKSACSREGVAVVELPAPYTTRECHACGYAHEWDQAASIMHRCGGCGMLWDQDLNAAKNLLKAWGQMRASGGAMPEVASDKKQRVTEVEEGAKPDRSQTGLEPDENMAAGD